LARLKIYSGSTVEPKGSTGKEDHVPDAYIPMMPGALGAVLQERGLGYREVADLAEIDRSTVSRLVRGATPRASRPVALALLLVLDVRPSMLFVVPSRAHEMSH
jgi:hypothetical protein